MNIAHFYLFWVVRMLSILADCDRGIFGIQSSKKAEIEGLIERLEEANESKEPTKNLEQV